MKSILEVLSNYIEEARFSDILNRISGDDKFMLDTLKKERDRKFTEDRNLPTQTTLKKRYNNKKIKVWFNWNHTAKHNLVSRIENRTNLKSINEFSEIFINAINTILPDYIGYPINRDGRYGIYLEEDNISIIFYIKLNRVPFGESNEIYVDVITILTGEKIIPKTVQDVFYL